MKNRGYYIVEPPIYDQLKWEMDTIVACLEVIRRRVPREMENFPDCLEIDLIAVISPHGPSYPALGIYHLNNEKPADIPDTTLVDPWVETISIEKIQKQAKEIDTLTWEQLKKKRCYP